MKKTILLHSCADLGAFELRLIGGVWYIYHTLKKVVQVLAKSVDYSAAFESIADYLQKGDLYARCWEVAEINTNSFLGSIIAGLKPLDLLAYYKRLCELNRKRGYYNDEVNHLQSLPIIEHFIMVCEMQALKWWQMEIESLESLKIAE